jgi:hypothetical protein
VSRANPKSPARSSETALDIDHVTRVRNVRVLARFLDSSMSIPGTSWKFGFDAVVGLVPVVGDLIGGVLSGYIILEAARAEVPVLTLARMLVNLGIDVIVGAVPALGDLFDAAWKANLKNVALLERHLEVSVTPPREKRSVVGATLLALLVLLLIIGGGLALGVFVVRLLWGLWTR